jgi:plasmid stabilization system protein ParE
MVEPRRSVLWSSQALNDLGKIWDYYATVASAETADNILREIDKIVALIEDRPLAGRARDELRSGLRSFAAHPHVVFYRVTSGIEIVRIFDGRRDIEELFSEDDI